ncbi:hypothetical protein FHY11_000907 [Xanthomonas arboricola]|nr:hypothetical protein [Xanthomonas euroxanthea]
MVEKGLSERRALVVARMSASALRYEPRLTTTLNCASRSLYWHTGIDVTAWA